MAAEQRTWTAAQFRAHQVLTGHVDRELADLLVNEMGAAGVFGPRQFGSLDDLVADAEQQADPG